MKQARRKTCIWLLAAALLLPAFGLFGCSKQETGTPALMTLRERLEREAEVSPDWVKVIPEAQDAQQLFVVAAHEKTTAWVSMHEKDESGEWHMIMSTPGFIGKNGLGKTQEGDGMTPVGTFAFNRAFGIAPDPGCKITYVQADEDTYWSGDVNDGMHYNELVSLKDLPALDNCLGDRKPRTGGCVAIPMDQMYFVMQHVNPDCVVVIDSMENLGADF